MGAEAAVAGGKAKSKGSAISTFAALALVTVAGAGIGMMIVWNLRPPIEGGRPKVAGSANTSATGARDELLLELPSIIAQVRGDRKSWVRLDLSVVVAADLEGQQITAAFLSEDFLSYVQTLTLDDLGTPSALRILREDLEERARIRTKGKSKQVLFRSFVIE